MCPALTYRKSLPYACALMNGTTCSLLAAECEEMPPVALHPAARQRVEGADEERVERDALPSLVEAALHREPLEDQADVRESVNRLAKLARAVLPEHRRVLVLEIHLHQLRQGVEPRHAVVDLEHGLPAWLQDSPDFLRKLPAVPGVLDDPMCEDEVEVVVGKRQALAVGHQQPCRQALVREILPRKVNRRLRHVHSRHASAAAGEAHEIDAR